MPGETMGGAAILLAVWACAMLVLPYDCTATQYMVGDAQGWDISTDFNTWLSGKTFVVGDTLVFQYSSFHSLLEVKKAGYDSCQTGNALQSYTDGNTQVKLSSPGEKYFICGASGHCLGGMKLAINVTSASKGAPGPAPPSSDVKPVRPVPSAESDTPPGSSKSPSPKSAAPNIAYGVSPLLAVILVGCLLVGKL